MLIHGDSLIELVKMPDNSVDAIVTDPPYELGFMGKKWDASGIAYNVELWRQCLRVLKPGGHMLAFGGTRTHHRMVCAIEDAGFETRDEIMWVHGSGFPKSLNIGKAVDKLQGNEREFIKSDKNFGKHTQEEGKIAFGDYQGKWNVTKGNTPYEGLGTALKPAHEPICLARKPLSEKSVALNVLKWGTGGIGIDDCRVEVIADNEPRKKWNEPSGKVIGYTGGDRSKHAVNYGSPVRNTPISNYIYTGRFPANFIHDGSDEVLTLFPVNKGDDGSAARFFYCAKASGSERNAGCEELEKGKGCKKEYGIERLNTHMNQHNVHPTVKPIKLMQYLVKLVSRPGQIVLDPFGGSGTTAIACVTTGRQYILIEMESEYIDITKARVAHYEQQS